MVGSRDPKDSGIRLEGGDIGETQTSLAPQGTSLREGLSSVPLPGTGLGAPESGRRHSRRVTPGPGIRGTGRLGSLTSQPESSSPHR